MEKIEVGYKPVEMAPGYFHKYIVYTDSSGTEHLAEIQWHAKSQLLAIPSLTYVDVNGQSIQPVGTMSATVRTRLTTTMIS